MRTKSFLLAFLLQVATKTCVNAAAKPEIDKTPWKPVIPKPGNRSNARQYYPSPSNSQAYSGPQQQMVARPVTYVPPQVTFNPPQVLYGSPSVTRAVSPSSSSQYRQIQQTYGPSSTQQNYMPSPQQIYASPPQQSYMPSPQQNYVQASAAPVPSYAAPVQAYQYVMSQPPTPSPTPPQSFTYQLVPQQSSSNTYPQSSQPSASTTYSQSALPPPNFTLTQSSPSSAAPKSYGPAQGYNFQLVQQPPSGEPTPPAPTIIFTPTTPAPYKLPSELSPQVSSAGTGSNPDNATFVDVVTTLSRYFRATGTQLSEMFTQLNNNTEMNTWGFNSWTTPTPATTTTPAPTTPHPAHQPSVVVMPIMMPSPPQQAPPPTYSQPQPVYLPPPPPPPPSYPQQMYAQPPPPPQPQPSYSQPQPLYSQPPPTYSQPPPPTYSHPPVLPHPHPPPANPQGKMNNNFEATNSIEHDYYYDCDK